MGGCTVPAHIYIDADARRLSVSSKAKTRQEQVPGAFGVTDGRFGVHPNDQKRAKGAISAAKAAGATWEEDFEKEVVYHCYKN